MNDVAETQFETAEARWQAVANRQPEADGRFFYAVVTTGVFCRPSCPSRLPLRQNVRFFGDVATAEAEGFRPCKRCQPDQPHATPHHEAILHACRQLEEAVAEGQPLPTLDQLAAEAGLSPFHFQRLFKKVVGISPKQYGQQKRQARVQAALHQQPTVTDAVQEAGFGSGSRFYEQATAVLGMKPTTYQNGAADQTMQLAVAQFSLGWVVVAATPQGICAIELGDDPDLLAAQVRGRFPHAHQLPTNPAFAQQVADVIAFLDAPRPSAFPLPLDIQGTAFQRQVWHALQGIPAGETISYGELAVRVGNPRAVRAVAQACAANGLAVAIPCHRVVRGDGQLGGYRWGLGRKTALLTREGLG